MCRFLIYIGYNEVVLEDIISKPKHSLVHQSYQHYLPGLEHNVNAQQNLTKANIHLNGDGMFIIFTH